jgi:LPXTG-motif cell wall-anchored protein
MSTPESNGRGQADPEPPDEAAAAATADAELDDELDDDKLYDDGDREDIDEEPSTGLEIAFTPRQILGGFALLAALVLLLRRRKRDRTE